MTNVLLTIRYSF